MLKSSLPNERFKDYAISANKWQLNSSMCNSFLNTQVIIVVYFLLIGKVESDRQVK